MLENNNLRILRIPLWEANYMELIEKIFNEEFYNTKINLVKEGIFPITKDKDNNDITISTDTGFLRSGTLQGEGKFTGTPSLFIRTSGCNLRCVWKEKNISVKCDTPYSSFEPESNILTIDEIRKIIISNIGNISHVVISGGEPLLQKNGIENLILLLKSYAITITIETNGTIFNDIVARYSDLLSISPKLSTAAPTEDKLSTEFNQTLLSRHERDRYQIDVIQKYIDSCYNYTKKSGINYDSRITYKDFQLKFVISTPEDVQEIKEQYITKLSGVKLNDIVLMPEGTTSEEIIEKSKWVADLCVKNGFRFSTRLHILLFGNKRGV